MSDQMRDAAVEGEAPVNPYSLLQAVNDSSDTSHTAWLILIAIMSYLMVAVAGVTHKDLLLSSDIQLPILQVKIDLTRFFLFAPFLLMLFHLGVVSQLVMVARKTLEFDRALRMLEVSDRRTHPLRLELHNFFFVQAIAGPERSRIMSAFLHGMSWLTLVIIPVVMLLYVQVAFLPYHDVTITWVHRIALAADILLLILIGVFLTRPEQRFFQAFARQTRENPITFGLTTAVLVIVTIFSFFVATVPGERLDQWSRKLPGGVHTAFPSDRTAYGFVMPFLGARKDGTLFGIFERNLNVTDQDLVADKDYAPGDTSLNLRGRDLRYAKLDRTDLHRADLTGADLDGASLVAADLRGILLQCADIDEIIRALDRQAVRESARCPTARKANFTRAKLKDAHLSGADLQGAIFEDADLEAAELAHAVMTGTSFYSAQMQRAVLTGGVSLEGANFGSANLQGADLTGAKLYGADFSSAGLQGAVLAHAYLQGAKLRYSDMEAADLYKAKLQGASLTGARIKGATLREAVLWLTTPPERDSLQLSDLSDVVVRAPEEADVVEMTRMLEQIGDERARGPVKDALAALMGPDARRGWTGNSPDQQAWSQMSHASAAVLSDGYKAKITDYLTQLACKGRWSNGAVATGIARRARGAEFRGDIAAVHDRLTAATCAASKTMSQRALKALQTAVDEGKPN